MLRVVIDTNVLVSALLKPGSVPDRAVLASFKHMTVLYDARLLDEYEDVLRRPKMKLAPMRIEELLATMHRRGVNVGESTPWTGAMTDDDDRMFVEVAITGQADAIVTGNSADFPIDAGFEVLPPAKLLARLGQA